MGGVCSACAGEERPGRENDAPTQPGQTASEMSNAEKIKILKRASLKAKGFGAKFSAWLKDADCEEFGMPMLTMLEHLRTPPFVWDGFRTAKTSQWELVPFPWTAVKAQHLMKDHGIHLLADPQSDSMPAKIVNFLVHGETFFGGKQGNAKVLERVVPVLCVRVLDPSGKFLVQTETKMLREGYSDEGHLDVDETIRWPGKPCAEPQDVITEAELLIYDRAGIAIDGLIANCGEITLSPAQDDRFLSMKSRIVTHFVNARLKEPMAKDKFTHKIENGVESVAFDWWDAERCDAELPGAPGATTAFAASAAGAEESLSSKRRTFAMQDLLNDMHLEQPWDPPSVQRILKQHGVDLDLLAPLTTAEIASNLERGEWTLVHDRSEDAGGRVNGTPAARIALLNKDEDTCYFLPPKDMHRKAEKK
eukprot:gnl/MRDRNA2_/MRDRNA2_77719_c0_seq1.p1 gnl/MRDRNA2_/MRDRNA2_77719_c0~~gnl/MRDRNA2_/MRDRNA2_77719_c0_seq1.p1  ORF type:complete len:421 (+),score=103.80 gnl/MRDRNA2_/MRDRNA2_77719_c0_seq1:98-1360(+)